MKSKIPVKISTLCRLITSDNDSSLEKTTNLKELKASILRFMNFADYEKHCIEKRIIIKNKKDIKLLFDFCFRELKNGKYLSIRLIDDGGVKGGGYPVLYIFDKSDLRKRHLIKNMDTHLLISIKNKYIELKNGICIDIFSRKKSLSYKVKDLDNTHEAKEIRLGGGFRLQLSDISYKSQKLVLHFDVTIVWNDVGPRCTSLLSKYDTSVPHNTFRFSCSFNDGLLCSITKNEKKTLEDILKNENSKEIATFVINTLFYRNQEELTKFLQMLVLIEPSLGIHSIEGVFSIRKDKSSIKLFGPNIIDFDGLDTLSILDKEDKNVQKAILKKMLIYQFKKFNFIP